MPTQFSNGAAELLTELQQGNTFAEPNVYPHSHAFNDYAVAYLNNAAALCRTGSMDDHRIFGALYCLRHGVELWLKCFQQNAILDRALEEITAADSTFDSVAAACGQAGRKEKEVLQAALCAVRNVVEDGITFPACWERNNSRDYAERAVKLIRSIGAQPRNRISNVWAVRISEHRILPLWARVRDWVTEMQRGAAVHARQIGFPEPLDPQRLEVICELLNALDEAGVAFRYPTTLDGKWHFGLPHMNLEKLANIIDDIGSTVVVYDSMLRNGYSIARLRSPAPSYSEGY